MSNPIQVMSLPFYYLSNFLSNVFRVLMGLVLGYRVGGPGGAFAMATTAAREHNGWRRDGLVHTTPFVFKGVRLSNFPWFSQSMLEDALTDIAKFPVRDDDLFVIVYQKCGRVLLNEVLYMLYSGEKRLPRNMRPNLVLESFPKPLQVFGAKKGPRVIFTHLPKRFLPKQVLEGKCRVIRCSRNPKDMLVAHYLQCVQTRTNYYDDTFENFVRLNLEEPCAAQNGSYFAYEREYLKEFGGQDRVLHLTFEDLRTKTLETIKRIDEFLGLGNSAEFHQVIAKETAFEKIRIYEENPLYRRGKVGLWRRHVSVADNRMIDAKIKKEWGGTELETMFDYGDEDES